MSSLEGRRIHKDSTAVRVDDLSIVEDSASSSQEQDTSGHAEEMKEAVSSDVGLSRVV
jgi:hypothetical protein